MKFSEKVNLMIILKVAENQVFAHSLENKVLEKPKGGKIDSSQLLKVMTHFTRMFKKMFFF